MEIAEARPPYVTFEVQAEEDREASIAAGHYVARDVEYALVTPQGSKDRIPRKVEEWFDYLSQQSREGRFPEAWLANFRAQHKAWKEGRALPISGMPVANWPAVSPAQVKALQAAHVLSVEDLAAANEETIGRIGMGGRALKQRAIEWLAASSDRGKMAEEMMALKIRNEELESANKALSERLNELAKKVEALAPAPAPAARKL